MEQLSEFGTDGLILGLLLVFTVLGFIKKLVKLFFLVIALAVGAVAAIWAYNNGFSVAKILVEKPEPWMTKAIAGIAFFGAFFFAKTILGFLQGGSKETGAFKSFGFGIPGAVVSLGVGGVIAYGALTGARYAGTMAEMERLKDYANDIDVSQAEPLLAKVKNWIDNSRLGQLHQKIDFINDPAQANLAKLAIVQDKDGVIQKSDAEVKDDQLRDASQEAAHRDALMQLNIEKALGLSK